MRKKTFVVALAASVSISVFLGLKDTENNESGNSFIGLSDVEALSDCELIDGYEANGHCVHNDRNEYFCADASFWQTKDCRQ